MAEYSEPIINVRVLQEFYIDPKTEGIVYTHYRFQFRRANELEYENITVIPIQVDPPNEP